MSKPTFFTDEDIYAAVAVALRKAGLDAVSTPETGRLGESDDSQLAWAADQGRVLVTFNVAHYCIPLGLERADITRASLSRANARLVT